MKQFENNNCPFCHPDAGRDFILESDNTYSIFDKYPVSKGHALVIPRRHCSNYFELTHEEQNSCWETVNELKEILSEKFQPDGFNIGINVDEAAGQTVPHVHIHLIPRYAGDVDDPEGGVRGVIPDKKSYREIK